MHITEIALMAFLDDTKKLVADGVSSDVTRCVLEAGSYEDKVSMTERGKEREKYLKEWLAMEMPLSYGERDEVGPFRTLVQALAVAEKDIEDGLPNWTKNAFSRTDFVNLLLGMSAPSSPKLLSAPVLKDGAFFPILKEVHHNLISLSMQDTPSSQHTFITRCFLRAIDRLKIHFIPNHLPQHSHAWGPRRRKVVFNAWAQLGLPESRLDPPLPPSRCLPSSSHQAATVALTDALASDSNLDWHAKEISISNLHTVLHCTHLPLDFASISFVKEDYVNDTYAWVREFYDGTKPSHHLALIVGFIASAFAPTLFMPANDPSLNLKTRFAGAHTESQVRDLYNSIDWVSRDKKGMKDRSIFLAMFTTYVIALYEPASPLRQHIASSVKKGQGDPWTNKHSMSAAFLAAFH